MAKIASRAEVLGFYQRVAAQRSARILGFYNSQLDMLIRD
jgi:hypothetical protein